MAETLRLVVLNDDDTYSDVSGATYIEVSNPDVVEDITMGSFEGAKGFSGHAERILRIEDLVRVGVAATAVLDSEGGALSMAELALAVQAAGLGDFTEQYRDEIAFLAGEGQRG